MKFAICNEMFEGMPFEHVCKYVSSCGYDGIEIAPFTFDADPSRISKSVARAIGKTARDSGLELIAMHWLLAKPTGSMAMHLTTCDKIVRQRTIAFAQRLARLCSAMGAKVMVWGSPKQRDIAGHDDVVDATERAIDGVRAVCEVAGPLGVTVAMEPLGPSETNFLQFAGDTVDFIRRVDHPACRLHLDVKAMCQETQSIPEVIRDHSAHLAYFHANDANLKGPGAGDTDFVPIARALRDVHYEGYVSVEVFDYSPDPQSIARESIKYLKQAFGEAGAL